MEKLTQRSRGTPERLPGNPREVPRFFFRGPGVIPQRLQGTSLGKLEDHSGYKKVGRRKYE
jgi:hypothetical protein